MRPLGLLLILFGLLAFAYQGFSYTTQKKVVDLGPIEVSKESTRHIPLPPLAAAGALVSGVVLVAVGARK